MNEKFVQRCNRYYNENKSKLDQDCLRTHEFSIEKKMVFKVPSDVEEIKLVVETNNGLDKILNEDELKKVAIAQMKHECRDINLDTVEDNVLSEDNIEVMKYCIKTGGEIIDGVYKFVCTMDVKELIKMFGEVIKDISVDSMKKVLKIIKNDIKLLFSKKKLKEIEVYLNSCSWFKFCKFALVKIINFIHKLCGRTRESRDFILVEGMYIHVPCKSIAEAYKFVISELQNYKFEDKVK